MVLDPTTLRPAVRNVAGIEDSTDIDDANLDAIIEIAIRNAIDDIYQRRWDEGLIGESGGAPFMDGSNKTFYVENPPIADHSNNGAVDNEDITITYYDENLDLQTAVVVVENARRGKLTVTTDGSTALPLTTTNLKADYWTVFREVNENMLKDAVVYLACHYVQLRMTEPDSITLRDLESSSTLIRVLPTRFWILYNEKIRRVKRPTFGVF